MVEKICKYCGKNIIVEKHIYFAQHVATCKNNPDFEDRKQKYRDLFSKEKIERKTIKKECPRCKNEFELTGTEKQLFGRDSKKYCSDKCARARPQSKETKEKISISLSRNNSKKVFSYNCEICGEKGESLYKTTKNHLKCIRLNCGGYKKGSGFGKSGWYKGYSCDSSWELAFLIFHLDNEILITRNKKGFEYVYENEKHLYYPDFIINNEYFEIKGFLRENDSSKFDYFPHELVLIDKEKIKPYLEYTINKYGKNFISLYDNKIFQYEKTCEVCDTIFTYSNKKTCSKKCADKLSVKNRKK